MTDPRDPIDDWLGSDVELLPPRPNAFERIHRQARRRKAARALSAVAGAAVLVAAIAVVPQIAAALRQGSAGPDSASSAGSGLRSKVSRTPSAGPTRLQSPNRSLSIAPPGPSLTGARSSSPAPKDFRPTSVTFTGSLVGAVLGQASSPCSGGACTSVAGTADYAGSWFRVGAPPAGAPLGSTGVSQIRFGVDARNGWAYGPELWATHDGGSNWKRIRLPGHRVIDLATVQDRAFAVAASCTGTGPSFAANCTSFQLYTAAATSDQWNPVGGASAGLDEDPGGLQLTDQIGYLIADGSLVSGPVTGGAWHAVSIGSRSPACLRGTDQRSLADRTAARGPLLIAPTTGTAVFLACDAAGTPSQPSVPGRLTLYSSSDEGRSWLSQGAIGVPARATSLAIAPGGDLVLATNKGIYYDSGTRRTWRAAFLSGGAPAGGFTFIGMTEQTLGVAVPFDSGFHEIFVTRDGGHTWTPSPIG